MRHPSGLNPRGQPPPPLSSKNCMCAARAEKNGAGRDAVFQALRTTTQLEEPQDTMVCQFVGHLSSNFVRLRQQMNRGPGTEQQPIQCRSWLSSAGHKLRHGVLVFRQSLRGVRSRKGWPRAEVTSPWA